MKKVLKKIILILIILMLLFSINSKVFAWSEIVSDGQSFINQGESKIDNADLQNASGYLYNILLATGVVIAVIVATVLGVQFIIGGAEGQAKVKEMMLPYIVGCIIVFGGFGLWKIAVTVGDNLENANSSSYTKDESTGKLYCECGDELSVREQHQGKCSNCGKEVHGI